MEWWPPPRFGYHPQTVREARLSDCLWMTAESSALSETRLAMMQAFDRGLSYLPSLVTVYVALWSLWYYPKSTIAALLFAKVSR